MTFTDFVFKPAEVSRELIASKITRLLTRRSRKRGTFNEEERGIRLESFCLR